MPRSSMYHLLSAMADAGFVAHYPEEERWGLGVGAFEIGAAYLRHEPLERLGAPVLRRLALDVAPIAPAVAHLGVLHGREMLYLLKESPRTPSRSSRTWACDCRRPSPPLAGPCSAACRRRRCERSSRRGGLRRPHRIRPDLAGRTDQAARCRAGTWLGRGGRVHHDRLRLGGRCGP